MKVKKRKIRYGRILVFLTFISLTVYFIIYIFNIKITNIYVSGNNYLTDQEIIDLALISNYPKSVSFPTWTIEDNIKKSDYIKNVTVNKEKLSIIKILIEENKPLFYNSINNTSVLENGKEVNKKIDLPILLNYVPDTIYGLLIEKMSLVDKEILNKISEIKHVPNEVDEERFLFTMTDGNYVYVTLNKLEVINNYISIIKNFDNKKGILSLDAGNVFEYFK